MDDANMRIEGIQHAQQGAIRQETPQPVQIKLIKAAHEAQRQAAQVLELSIAHLGRGFDGYA